MKSISFNKVKSSSSQFSFIILLPLSSTKSEKLSQYARKGCLSKEPLYKNYNYNKVYIKLTNKKTSEKITTINFKELEKKFNIKFNTLVIDCENCYSKKYRSWNSIG